MLGIPEAILSDAARHVAAHGLRAFDAIQLSSAMLARGADADCTRFACFEQNLRAAAVAVGFRLIPDRFE